MSDEGKDVIEQEKIHKSLEYYTIKSYQFYCNILNLFKELDGYSKCYDVCELIEEHPETVTKLIIEMFNHLGLLNDLQLTNDGEYIVDEGMIDIMT